VYIIANDSLVCFPGAVFLGLSDVPECLGGLHVTGQVSIQLKISTQLASELGH